MTVETYSVRIRLRNETRDWHELLERQVDVTSPGFDLNRYRQILRKFYGFYSPWEERAGEVCRNLPDAVARRRKTPALRADLECFGILPDEQPMCRELPEIRTVAEALGGCYVLEGATLGGQIISRHVKETLGLGPENGCRFFSGYGAETGRMWRSFEELLHRECEDDNANTTVAGAKATFEAFSVWLRSKG
jgi:heme oxygenase